MKKLSIIIAVYNIEKYLDKCLNSVISQKGNDIEILIVDDGSVDNSLNICKKYQKKDKRIVIIHQENSGLSSSRNTGIENAKGEYLWFIDGDDYISNGSVNTIRKYLDKYDIVCFNYYSIRNDKIVSKSSFKEYDTIQDKYILNAPTVWNKVIKKDIVVKERFPEKCSYNDIYIIPTFVRYTNKIIFIDEYLYNYVYRTNSLSNKRNVNMNDCLYCLDHVYEKINSLYPEAIECYYIDRLLVINYLKDVNYHRKYNYKEANKLLKSKFPKYYKNKYYNNNFFRKIYIRLVYINAIFIVKLITYIRIKIMN